MSAEHFDATPLQKALSEQTPPYDPGPLDGVFGKQTQAAMQHWQRDHGLEETEFPVAAVYIGLGLPLPADLPAEVQTPPAASVTTIMDNPIIKLGLQILLSQLFSGKGTQMDSTKPWYTSSTIWSNIVAVLAVVLSFFHVDFGAADQATLITSVMQIVAAGAALWGIVSRWRATAKIG